MIVCTGVPPWIVLDLLQWQTQCLFTYIRSGSVSHYFPVGSPKLCFSRTGFVYVNNLKNSENSSISQLCFLSVIYLRFIITLVKGMFDLQIDKKNCLQWIKVVKKTNQQHSQNMLHVDVLYTIKRKKYKTVCAELAFTKSPSTEWSWFCIELIILFLYLLDSWIIAYSKSVWLKVGTLTVYIDIK